MGILACHAVLSFSEIFALDPEVHKTRRPRQLQGLLAPPGRKAMSSAFSLLLRICQQWHDRGQG